MSRLPDFVFEIHRDDDGNFDIEDSLFRCDKLCEYIYQFNVIDDWLFPDGDFGALTGDGPWFVAANFLETRHEYDVVIPWSELECECWLVDSPGRLIAKC